MTALRAPVGATSLTIGGAVYEVRDGALELPSTLVDQAMAHGFLDPGSPAHPSPAPQPSRPISSSAPIDRGRLEVALGELDAAKARAVAAAAPVDRLRVKQGAAEVALAKAQAALDRIAADEQAGLIAEAVGGAADGPDRTEERQRAKLVISERQRELDNIRIATAQLEEPARAATLEVRFKLAAIEDAAAAVLIDRLTADLELMDLTIQTLNKLQANVAGARLALGERGRALLDAGETDRAMRLFRALEALSARLGSMTRLQELSPAVERRAADLAADWMRRLIRDPAAELESGR